MDLQIHHTLLISFHFHDYNTPTESSIDGNPTTRLHRSQGGELTQIYSHLCVEVSRPSA